MKTIESLDGTVYEIEVLETEILLHADSHTMVLKIKGDFDRENVEKYIDENFDQAFRFTEL